MCHILGFSLRHGTDDIRISRISDGQCAHTEVLSTSGTQFIVVSSVMMDSSLGQHGVVLDFRFSAKTQNKRSILFKHLTLYFVFLKFLTKARPAVVICTRISDSPGLWADQNWVLKLKQKRLSGQCHLNFKVSFLLIVSQVCYQKILCNWRSNSNLVSYHEKNSIISFQNKL